MNHNYPTDIITFPYGGFKEAAGDVFICPEVTEENAESRMISPVDELNRVICHGFLHLLGFKDQSDPEKEEMRKQEDSCLERIRELDNV